MFVVRFDVVPILGMNRNASQLPVPPSLTLRAYDFQVRKSPAMPLDLPGSIPLQTKIQERGR